MGRGCCCSSRSSSRISSSRGWPNKVINIQYVFIHKSSAQLETFSFQRVFSSAAPEKDLQFFSSPRVAQETFHNTHFCGYLSSSSPSALDRPHPLCELRRGREAIFTLVAVNVTWQSYGFFPLGFIKSIGTFRR